MNTAQFMSVIKKAWPRYVKEYKACEYSYMCNGVKDCKDSGEISKWQCCEAINKIIYITQGKFTLAAYLRGRGIDCGKRHKAAYFFWEQMIIWYDKYKVMPTSEDLIQYLKTFHQELFETLEE